MRDPAWAAGADACFPPRLVVATFGHTLPRLRARRETKDVTRDEAVLARDGPCRVNLFGHLRLFRRRFTIGLVFSRPLERERHPMGLATVQLIRQFADG